MLFSTYDELKASVTEFLTRDDITSHIPGLILLAEAKFNRKCRQGGAETSTTLTPTSGVAALPSDYAEWRAVNDTSSGLEIRYVTPSTFREDATPTTSGRPRSFTIIGTSLHFAPQSTGTVTLVYYRGITGLSASNTSNWLLTSHPDLYLYAVLAETYAFLKDYDEAARFEAKAEGAFQAMVEADRAARWGRAIWRTTEPTP